MLTYPEVAIKILEGYQISHKTILAMAAASTLTTEEEATEFIDELGKSLYGISIGFKDFANDVYLTLEKTFIDNTAHFASIFGDHLTEIEEKGGDNIDAETKEQMMEDVTRKLVVKVYGLFMEGFLTALTPSVRELLEGQ